ncbi:MAG: PilN domain-containing protein [Bacteriovoracaceae bacterium]|nr:PilN domain-containing protein [Bacteriovoracaceae bacterium]
MIEINLIKKKKIQRVTSVAGIDLSKLNLKAIAVAVIIYFAQDLYFPNYLAGEEAELSHKISLLTDKHNAQKRELKKHQNIKEKLKLYERRRNDLLRRSSYVDKILQTRTNPKKILERLARSVPDDMWLESIIIRPDKQIIIKGRSEAYKSIGDFLAMANDSAFFGGSLTLSSKGSSTQDETLYGKKKRIEVYEIIGRVEMFDPWLQK